MDAILELMAAHRSVRTFLTTPVPDAHIHAAVSAARQAATSSWVQAYHLLQVTDATTRERFAELAGHQPQVERAGAFFVVSADTRRHRLIAERAGQPHVANLETFLVAVIDATLFAQNLTLAFESQGYGTCYIGGLRNQLFDVDALLELPDAVWPLFGLCVGEPDPAAPTAPRPRLAPDALWTKDRYPSDDAILAAVDELDVLAREHYGSRGHAGRDWSSGIWRKFTQAFREDLAAFYTAKGARLE